MEPTRLEQSVFKTVAWFSLFGYPLTVFEVHKWLIEPDGRYDLAQVYKVLETSEWLSRRVWQEGAFVSLRGTDRHEGQVARRHERFLDAVRKYRLARRASAYMKLVPGVRAVSVGNTLAFWHTDETSDIDLFIVTSPGRLWSSRLLLVLPFVLLGKRPGTPGVKDPFCFSFFVDADSLQLESLCLERDYYMAMWVKSLVPLFDRSGVMGEVARVNRWADVMHPHARGRCVHGAHETASVPSFGVQPRLFDRVCASFQRKRLPALIADQANQDSCVVVSDQVLKFHTNDRREQYRDAYERIIEKHV